MRTPAIPLCILLIALTVGACAPATGRFDVLYEDGRGPATDGTLKVTRYESAAQGSVSSALAPGEATQMRKISIGGSYHRMHSIAQGGDNYKTKLGLHGDPTRNR